MGVSHTLWPPSITRAILACLRFAQGLHRNQKSKQQSHYCVTVVCTGFAQDTKKSKQQSHSCVPAVCTGFVQDTKKSKQQSHSCVTAVCTGFHRVQKIKTAEPLLRDCGLHRASRQIKTASKGIIRKNANHLQTTCTLKRHQRYSIRYHCG